MNDEGAQHGGGVRSGLLSRVRPSLRRLRCLGLPFSDELGSVHL